MTLVHFTTLANTNNCFNMRSSTSTANLSPHEDLFAFLLGCRWRFSTIFCQFPGWVVSEKRRPFWRLGQKGDPDVRGSQWARIPHRLTTENSIQNKLIQTTKCWVISKKHQEKMNRSRSSSTSKATTKTWEKTQILIKKTIQRSLFFLDSLKNARQVSFWPDMNDAKAILRPEASFGLAALAALQRWRAHVERRMRFAILTGKNRLDFLTSKTFFRHTNLRDNKVRCL